jgi:chaperone BCS1
VDVWIQFTNATKAQAEGIFNFFFQQSAYSSTQSSSPTNIVPGQMEIVDLAKRFADAIPDGEMSVRLIFLLLVSSAEMFSGCQPPRVLTSK